MSRNPHFYLRKKRNGASRSGSCAYCHKDGHYARDKKRQITCPALRASEERKNAQKLASKKELQVRAAKKRSEEDREWAEALAIRDGSRPAPKQEPKKPSAPKTRRRPPKIVTQFSGLDFSSADDSPSTDKCQVVEAEIAELQEELAQAVAKGSASWADQADITDIEEKIEELEAQLA